MPINKKFLEKYKSSVFVETGSYKGDGIQLALDVGFKYIYSIEIMQEYYNFCKNRFINNKNVYLYLGDSKVILKTILDKIDTNATFWLDGHYFGPEVPIGTVLSPLMEEVEIISQHFIKNHTILIDDVRLWEKEYAIKIPEVIKTIKSINNGYCITFEDGVFCGDKDYYEKDVLVAKF